MGFLTIEGSGRWIEPPISSEPNQWSAIRPITIHFNSNHFILFYLKFICFNVSKSGCSVGLTPQPSLQKTNGLTNTPTNYLLWHVDLILFEVKIFPIMKNPNMQRFDPVTSNYITKHFYHCIMCLELERIG
jgi:hypothetical protein